MRFRKKPVVIEAEQFTSHYKPDSIQMNDGAWQVYDRLHDTWVNTSMYDWIITGVQGETYPCKPDVFAATYEQVEP